MTFLQGLNDYVTLLALLLGLIIFIGIRAGIVNGGWNRHLTYLFSLIIFAVYTLISPWYFYTQDKTTIIGTDISKYFGAGFFFNILAVLAFIIGYWIPANSSKNWLSEPERKTPRATYYISLMFYGFYAINLINLAIGGINLSAVFLGDQVLGLGASGASYYLQNFADSLICVLILAYMYDVPKKTLLWWVLAAFFLFSLLGFRYRIILSLFGFLFIYLYKNKVNVKWLLRVILLALTFFYFTMFSTVNRWVLISRNYERVEYNPLKFDYGEFFVQTRGALADLAIYKYYENPNKNAEYDYGLTMFGYVFIRMIPRSIYPEKDKFYPPPQLDITLKAYDAWWAYQSGEATLAIAAFYIAFGWYGIVIGLLLWGVFLKKFSNTRREKDQLQFVTYIAVTLVSFQWITRGYFPQTVDHAIYILIPIWLLRLKSHKIVTDENH